MPAFLVSIAAACSTMLGGSLALKLRDRLHLILGFSAGAVIAVAFFDLLPEALSLSSVGGDNVAALAAGGFFLYLLLDRLLVLGHHEAEGEHAHTHARGSARAASLSLHSLLDGVGIGLAFKVNAAVGVFVAIAVLTHDFSDGINTVSVVVRHGGQFKKALSWLLLDALAPVVGVVLTLFFAVSSEALGLLLGLFAGFFLYIGASDLIPESHHTHPTFWTTLMTLLGAFVLWMAIRLAA